MATLKAAQIFISYSHKDEDWLRRIETMLRPKVREGSICLWSDQRIKVGADWEENIRLAIASSQVAVFLFSPDFLASDFIISNELEPLFDAAESVGVKIVWICLRACLFEGTGITRFQAAHDPYKPLSNFRRPDQDKELAKICRAILSVAGVDEDIPEESPEQLQANKSRSYVTSIEFTIDRPLERFDEDEFRAALKRILGAEVKKVRIAGIRPGSVIIALEGDEKVLSWLIRTLTASTDEAHRFAAATGTLHLTWSTHEVHEFIMPTGGSKRRPHQRPYRGLTRLPDREYDAVIIGAGVGGLLTANLLAREGLKVLLVERHFVVGGYCNTFRREGYIFDAANHRYPLVGNPEALVGRLIQELGVATEWIKIDPADTLHFPDKSRFSVPSDFGYYIEKIKSEFPAEAAALDSFFAAVREAYLLGLFYHFRQRKSDRLSLYQSWTLRETLDRWFKDEKLKLLLATNCLRLGTPPDRTSFVIDSMQRLSYFLGNYYPKGGSQVFVDDLARRFEEHGGHVLTSAPVRRILVEDGAARGVELDIFRGVLQGTSIQVHAEAVIANSDLWWTLKHLVGERHLQADALEFLRPLRPSYSCFVTHLGLKGVSVELMREVQGYYWDSWDMDRIGGGDALRFSLFVPSLYSPELAPEGGQILIAQKLLGLEYDAVKDWKEQKQRLEASILSGLEEVIPGVREKIVVKRSSTPRNAWELTLNYHGAMAGWEMSPDQVGEYRPGSQCGIKNLYFVGHWTRPGGGITNVVVSAMNLVKTVKDSFGRTLSRGEPEAPVDIQSLLGLPGFVWAPSEGTL